MFLLRTLVLIGVCFSACPNLIFGQANVVLRDLTLISDRTINSFDQNAVRLSDGSELSWDQILRGHVAVDQQGKFDRYVRDIGLPLFQMKQRIRLRDWTRLNEIADLLFVQYSGEDSTIGKTVCLASAKGKLETGERAAAVLPFLMATVKQSTLSDETLGAMGYQPDELEIGVSVQLLPVWFDLDLAKVQRQALMAFAAELGDKFPEGGFVYLASFSLALEEFEEAKRFANQISGSHETLLQWRQLLLSEVDRRTRVDLHRVNRFQVDAKTPAEVRAASRYFDAIAAEKSMQEGNPLPVLLEHMKVAALWGEQFPNLSSAAMYRAVRLAKSAEMSKEAETISKELLSRYSKSYHGKIIASENRR